jgi:hypothetical protein
MIKKRDAYTIIVNVNSETAWRCTVPSFTRVVVTGSRNFHDDERIEADLRALLPLGLTRVAQGGNGVKCERCNGRGGQCSCCGGSGLPTGHCEACTPLDRRTAAADALAWRAAHRLGLDANTYRVDERLDGRWPVCGPGRNRRMLLAERPELVLAYPTPSSKGTWNCIAEARRLDISVLVWIHWAVNSDASRIVMHALQARGVRLAEPTAVCGPRALRGQFDRDEHRVLVGPTALAATLPEEIDG